MGIIVAGADDTGVHIYECQPSGNFYDYIAVSIGARSQSAKTYLEKYYQQFESCMFKFNPIATLDQLILHGLNALRDTLQQDKELNTQNVSIGVVGKNMPWTVYENDALSPFLAMLNQEAPPAAATASPVDAPMETE